MKILIVEQIFDYNFKTILVLPIILLNKKYSKSIYATK